MHFCPRGGKLSTRFNVAQMKGNNSPVCLLKAEKTKFTDFTLNHEIYFNLIKVLCFQHEILV